MGLYTNKAFGLFLYDAHTVADATLLKGHVDFIIGYAGKGQIPSLKLKDWYNLAKSLDVPFIGYVETDPEISVGWTLNPAVWPDPEHDPTCKMLEANCKYNSGIQVPVDAWIVDGSKYLQSDNKTYLTEGWIKEIWEYEINNVFKKFKKSIYPYIKKETVNRFDPSGMLISYLSRLASVSSYEAANNVVKTGWGNAFIPADTEGPLQPYSPMWDFWYYGACVVPGITGAAPLFLSSKDKAGLYAEIGFKPTSTGNTGGGDNGGNNGGDNGGNTGGNTGGTVNVDMTDLVAQMKRIADAMSVKKSFTITISVKED